MSKPGGFRHESLDSTVRRELRKSTQVGNLRRKRGPSRNLSEGSHVSSLVLELNTNRAKRQPCPQRYFVSFLPFTSLVLRRLSAGKSEL